MDSRANKIAPLIKKGGYDYGTYPKNSKGKIFFLRP